MTKAQGPTGRYISVQTDLMPESAYRFPTLDLLLAAGFSKTEAIRILQYSKQVYLYDADNKPLITSVPVPKEQVLDFLDRDSDGFIIGARVFNFKARRLTKLEKARLWLCRHSRLFDREWGLPRSGNLVKEA